MKALSYINKITLSGLLVFAFSSCLKAQDTYSTMIFLEQYNSARCAGAGDNWGGMICTTANKSDSRGIVDSHRVNSDNGMLTDLDKIQKENKVDLNIDHKLSDKLK